MQVTASGALITAEPLITVATLARLSANVPRCRDRVIA